MPPYIAGTGTSINLDWAHRLQVCDHLTRAVRPPGRRSSSLERPQEIFDLPRREPCNGASRSAATGPRWCRESRRSTQATIVLVSGRSPRTMQSLRSLEHRESGASPGSTRSIRRTRTAFFFSNHEPPGPAAEFPRRYARVSRNNVPTEACGQRGPKGSCRHNDHTIRPIALGIDESLSRTGITRAECGRGRPPMSGAIGLCTRSDVQERG
jgi:hypothetical protein